MGESTRPVAEADRQVAPAPELAEAREEAAVRRGLAGALVLGGVIWAAALGAAIYFLRR
jgi:hypothetical protein